jgi:hypothetical protein
VGSNAAGGMDVCLLCLYVVLSCVDRGLYDALITRPQESYRVSKITKPEKRGSVFHIGTGGFKRQRYVWCHDVDI